MKKYGFLLVVLFALLVLAGCSDNELHNSGLQSNECDNANNPDNGSVTDVDFEALALKIEDVSPRDWFFRYVVAGLRYGLITIDNSENRRFEPDRYVTQGEFITMLGRLHEYGHGIIGTENCDPNYEMYIEWALEMGIAHKNRYWDLMPHEYITREQKAMIVHYYIEHLDLWDYFLHEYFLTMAYFWDANEMSDWAQLPIERLRLRLLIYGRYGMYYKPHAFISHAEALAILSSVGSAVYDLVHPLRSSH